MVKDFEKFILDYVKENMNEDYLDIDTVELFKQYLGISNFDDAFHNVINQAMKDIIFRTNCMVLYENGSVIKLVRFFKNEESKKKNTFTWIGFFDEYINKIASYRNNRLELVNKLKVVYKLANEKFINYEGGNEVFDIDPFTVLSILSRYDDYDRKAKFAKAIKDVFEIKHDIPTDYIGIYNRVENCLYEEKYREKDYIDKLWSVFVDAIEYGKSPNEFDLYERVRYLGDTKSGIGKVTASTLLYYFRPLTFVPIDDKMLTYFKSKFDVSRYLGSKGDSISNDDYLEYCSLVDELCENEHKIIPTIVYDAQLAAILNRTISAVLDDSELIKIPRKILNNELSKKILFCNIAYMKYYQGIDDNDIPVNGGKYVDENNKAYEMNNFLDREGIVRGYVETGDEHNHKNLAIERIDKSALKADYVDNVLVVFCANSPKKHKSVIVGFYENARVYRSIQVEDDFIYNIECKSDNACLIPEFLRTLPAKRARLDKDGIGFGQYNVWYAKDEKDKEKDNKIKSFTREVINYTENIKKKIIKLKIEEVNTILDDQLCNSVNEEDEDFDEDDDLEEIKPVKKGKSHVQNNVNVYERNPKTAKKALKAAKFKCEINGTHETFVRKNNKNPYTEAHHLVPMFAQDDFVNSLDVKENIISLCPTCHRRIHYGEDNLELVKKLFTKDRQELLRKRGIDITLEELLEYYK